jgi:peroxiredoxin Q/BCP
MKSLFLVCAAVAMLAGSQQEPGLQPGDPAPDFSLPGSDGRTYSLADFKGQRPVVLAWFPRANVKT